MLGRGGLLGLDATLNAMRDDQEQHPIQSRARTSRSALGAVAPLFGGASGVIGQSSLAEPAEPKEPGPIWKRLGQTF